MVNTEKNEHYAFKANNGWKMVIFEPGDWVWMYMHNERFSERRRSKLIPIGDGPVKSLKELIRIPTKWIYKVSIVLVLKLKYFSINHQLL
jgi:hypothetical protein